MPPPAYVPTALQTMLWRIITESASYGLFALNAPAGGGAPDGGGVAASVVRVAANLAVPYGLAPMSSPFATAVDLVDRLDRVERAIRFQRLNGNLHPWIMPRLSAMSFDAVYQACVAFMVFRRENPVTGAVSPETTEFGNQQIRIFCELMGDDRLKQYSYVFADGLP